MIARVLGRIIVVPLAFLLAGLASIAVLLSLGSERLTHAMHGRDEAAMLDAVFEFLRQGMLLLGAATIIPAVLVVIVGEVARIRSWLYYVLGGGAAMAAIPLIARLGDRTAEAASSPLLWQVFATAGFAGGFVYWLLAGRRA